MYMYMSTQSLTLWCVATYTSFENPLTPPETPRHPFRAVPVENLPVPAILLSSSS